MKQLKQISNALVATLTIIILTIIDFAIIATNVVSYAIGVIKTNSENVEFLTYFINEEGEKVESIEAEIESMYELYIEIAIKNEGYFNGQISLEDENFKFINNTDNEHINEISENTITLKQINAGSTVTIKVGIEAKHIEEISTSYLSNSSLIKLTGTYVNSAGNTEIDGTSTVGVKWYSKENTEAEIETELLTNKIYSVNGENKRIIQVLVKSKITDNNYPVKTSLIEIDVPGGVENLESVNVYSRGTDATNGEGSITSNNYSTNSETGKLLINVQNNEDESGNINWKKNATDNLIVTYVYNENTQIEQHKIDTNIKIELYDGRQIESSSAIDVEENKDGIVDISISENESEIYKGKIYSKEEREYMNATIANINFVEAINEIEIYQNESIYKMGDLEENAVIEFTQTILSKSEVENIIGEEGNIEILDQNDGVVSVITNQTEADENGYIYIDYENGVSNVTIKVSNPLNQGKLQIINKKVIKQSGLSDEELRELTEIKDSVSIAYITETNETNTKETEKEISLKETTTKANIEIGQTNFLTEQTNEDVKIEVTLLADGEDKDLYKNPTVKIIFPSQVEELGAKYKLLYGNGLEIQSGTIYEEQGKKVLEFKLDGTQEQYEGEAVDGTTILVYADVTLDNTQTNAVENIVLNYTNENAVTYADEGTQETQVDITSNSDFIITNDLPYYDIETVGEQEENQILLDTNSEGVNTTVNFKIANNEEVAVSNVQILGKLPTDNSVNNLGVTLISGLNVSGIEEEKIKIYYSNRENPDLDIENLDNGWTQELNLEEAKSFLIVIEQLEQSEGIDVNYEISIPGELSYNQKAQISYSVTYTNTENSETSTINSTILSLMTEVMEETPEEDEEITEPEEDNTEGTDDTETDKEEIIEEDGSSDSLLNDFMNEDMFADEEEEVVEDDSWMYDGVVFEDFGEDGEGEGSNNTNNETGNENDDPIDIEEGTIYISGLVWLDENRDGIRDAGERLLNGISVILINSETNEIVQDSNGTNITATTNSNGEYALVNIPEGNYIVVFEYDTNIYTATTYQTESAGDANNSDAISKTATIDGETRNVAATDTINIGESRTNIDLGLVETNIFDLELKKTVSQIIVTNQSGTKTYNFDSQELAKVEISSKYLSGSVVQIEYKIKITNTGNTAGYAENIVDYKSKDLSFTSNENSGWTQSGNNLYNNSLENELIQPGETKELTLILSKTMTENNTGLVNNTAEIESSYGLNGLTDTDSVNGNQAQGEDDMGSADVIIGLATGALITYIGIVLSTFVIIGVCIYVIKRKKNNI